MKKYIEELAPGDTFFYEDVLYILTTDFKKNSSRLCYSLSGGEARWMGPSDIVETSGIYYLDNTMNIVAVKKHSGDTNEMAINKTN